MDNRMYHASYVQAVGMQMKTVSTHDFEVIHDLVKQSKPDEDGYCNIYSLTVIWGEKLEFEPLKIVERWGIKKEPTDG